MELSTPPITPEIVLTQPNGTQKTINTTLPLHMQKSNFEERFNGFKEDLSSHQRQLDVCKIELLSCQNQSKKDHKQVKILNRGIKGFIEDQSRVNQNVKTKIIALDSEQLQLNELITALAETATALEERVKTTEQNILKLTQSSSDQKDAIDKLSKTQTTLSELITTLTKINESSQARIEKSENHLSSLQEIIALQQSTLQQQNESIQKQNQSISNITQWLYATTTSSVILAIGLWYYSRK